MRRVDGKSIVLGGLGAGLLVGLVDGLRAGMAVGVGALGSLASAGLAGAVDLLLGLGFAIAFVIGKKLNRWGRAGLANTSRRVEITAWTLVGLGSAFAAAKGIIDTAHRHNRFLVAGVVMLAATLAALFGVFVAPALGRVLAPIILWLYPRIARSSVRVARFVARRPAPNPAGPARSEAKDDDPGTPDPTIPSGIPAMDAPPLQTRVTVAGLLLFAPAVTVALAALVFVIVWRTRAPLEGNARLGRLVLAGLVAFVMPAAIAIAAGKWRRLRLRIAAPVALVLFTGLAVWFLRAHWTAHLRYVPWRDLRVIGFVIAVTAAAAPLAYRYGPRGGKRIVIYLLAPPAALLLALWAGSAEKARKATATAGGVVGPLLGLVRPALDFDHDGYPGLLGGGDCDDGNPRVNPGIQDWPEDGVDEDCDGADVRAADLRPPPPFTVPAVVPRDLNFLFIVVDSLRADRLGISGYGRPITPEIDRLARDGTWFENAWAHAPSTRHSMPAIVTGRWPSAIKWDTSIWYPGIARGQRTLAEVMRDAGYFNGAFYATSYFNRGDARGFERGIDQYDDRLAGKHVSVAGPAESIGSSAREMADDGIDFLRAYQDQKFFLSLHFYDPHLGYQRHPEAPKYGERPSDLYDGEIWYTDRHIGRVLTALRQFGLYDKTAIILTSDHGESFGEHGSFGHQDLYAPSTKVPLIMRVPGLAARRSSAPVGHVDIAPTVVNLARANPEPAFLGRSLLDLVAGLNGAGEKVPPPAAVFQESSHPPESPSFGASATERRGLVTATHHLIWKVVPENAVFCYDRRADPGELRDVWGLPPGEGVCPDLKKALDRRLSLLKLSDLPADFSARLSEGVASPGTVVPAPASVRPARFGDLVGFAGFAAKIPGAPFPPPAPPAPPPAAGSTGPGNTPIVTIARGGQVELATQFEVQGDLTGWRIFFHLDGPGGTWRNLDHTPVAGAYPVERWRKGQTIRDRFNIVFSAADAPGLHTLSIGFWRPPATARHRLPVTPAELQDGQDRLRVVSFLVQ